MIIRLSDKPYLRILRSLVRTRFIPTPLILVWEITYRCNMDCWFCNIPSLDAGYYKNEMETERCLELLQQAGRLGVGFLYLTGGEPLLREDIGEILSLAKKARMITMLGTNGFFVEEKINQLDGRLDILRVSIDSLRDQDAMRKTAFSLERSVSGIKKAMERKLKVVINVTITSKTFNEMEDLARFAEGLGCEITLSPLTVIPKGKEMRFDLGLLPDYQEYADRVAELRKRYKCVVKNDLYLDVVRKGGIGYSGFTCKAPYNILSITPQGEICFPCNAYPLKRIDINKYTTLDKAWHTSLISGLRKEVENCDFCRSCINRCYILPSLLFSAKGMLNFLRGSITGCRIF